MPNKIIATLRVNESELDRLKALGKVRNMSGGALILERAFNITTEEYKTARQALADSDDLRHKMHWQLSHSVAVFASPEQEIEFKQMASLMADGNLSEFCRTCMYAVL